MPNVDSGELIQATNAEMEVLDDAELDAVTGGQFTFNDLVLGVGVGQIGGFSLLSVGIGQIFLVLGQPTNTAA